MVSNFRCSDPVAGGTGGEYWNLSELKLGTQFDGIWVKRQDFTNSTMRGPCQIYNVWLVSGNGQLRDYGTPFPSASNTFPFDGDYYLY